MIVKHITAGETQRLGDYLWLNEKSFASFQDVGVSGGGRNTNETTIKDGVFEKAVCLQNSLYIFGNK